MSNEPMVFVKQGFTEERLQEVINFAVAKYRQELNENLRKIGELKFNHQPVDSRIDLTSIGLKDPRTAAFLIGKLLQYEQVCVRDHVVILRGLSARAVEQREKVLAESEANIEMRVAEFRNAELARIETEKRNLESRKRNWTLADLTEQFPR